MKAGEKGYALLERLVAITIMVVASGDAGAAIFQVLKNTERNNDYMTAVRQVEKAGYWISRDAQMARVVTTTDNLTPPLFLSLSWTAWDADGTPTYYSANYTFEDMTDGVGKLKRIYGSTGASEETLIAQYIYYDLDDVANTSNTSFENSVLTVKLAAVFEEFVESREYKIKRRPDL